MGSCGGAVQLVTCQTVGLTRLETEKEEIMMKVLIFVTLAVVHAQLPVSPSDIRAKAALPLLRTRKVQVSQPAELERREKSLLNSFPFNAQEHEDHENHGEHVEHGEHAAHEEHGEHGDHGEHGAHGDHGDKQANRRLNPLIARQGYVEASEQDSPNFAEIADSGKKCVQKVMMVEETVWEDHETCDHSYDKRCHKSFTTTYQSQQEEECDEVFRKICYIEMVDVAHNVTTQVCRKPLVKDCDIGGEIVCRTEYQSECWSKQIPHEVEDDVVECNTVQDEKCEDETVGYTTTKRCQKWPRQECQLTKKAVTKYTTMTGCNKEPTELCAPAGCGFKEGAEECHDETKTIVGEKPEEECIIEPQRQCRHVTKLVPQLQEVEECVDVPKETCTRSRTNPKKVKKPVIKKWCYIPSEESGLARK